MRPAALAAALVVLGAIAPSSVARATALAPRLPALASQRGWLRMDRSRGGFSVRQMPASPFAALREGITRRDPHALPGALRRYLAGTWPQALPDETQLAGLPFGTVHYGVPGGDLNGDRRDDVLDIELDVLTFRTVSLTARRGTDARPLWSLRFPETADVIALPVPDLNGDSAADFLLARFDVNDGTGASQCADVSCLEGGQVSYRWTYTLLSGRSGRGIWTQTFDGTETLADASGAAELGAAYATNGIVVPFLSGDHDHDGHPDVLFDAFDIALATGAEAAGADQLNGAVDAKTVAVATRATVVSGSSGRPIYARSRGLTPGSAALLPAGNAAGDGTPDLLWENVTTVASPVVCAATVGTDVCGGIERGTTDLELIDGSTMRTVWTKSFGVLDAQNAIVVPAGGDPSGDGHDDLLLGAVNPDGNFGIGVVSGATGDLLWTTPADPQTSVDVVHRLDGRRGDDVLLGNFLALSQPEAPLRVALRIDRLDGRSGRLLLRTQRVFADTRTKSIAAIDVYLPGDGNHDRVADVAVNALYRDTDINDFFSYGYVESGRTGALIWSRRTNGFALTQPAGDATNDGSADLLDLKLGEDDLTSSLVDLAPVRRVWTRADPVPDGFLSVTSGDQTGRGGDDQVFSRLRIAPRGVLSRIDGVEARTGRLTWGTGQTLPVRPRGKIAGRVRDTSGRGLSGVCAIAYTTKGEAVGAGASIFDGTYHVGRLRSGAYKIRFADCSMPTHAVRWYKQKQDMESADVVVVKNGKRTTGIDAVLPRA